MKTTDQEILREQVVPSFRLSFGEVSARQVLSQTLFLLRSLQFSLSASVFVDIDDGPVGLGAVLNAAQGVWRIASASVIGLFVCGCYGIHAFLAWYERHKIPFFLFFWGEAIQSHDHDDRTAVILSRQDRPGVSYEKSSPHQGRWASRTHRPQREEAHANSQGLRCGYRPGTFFRETRPGGV